MTGMGLRMAVAVAVAVAAPWAGLGPSPRAAAMPAPEVEYVYNVTVRRHVTFPDDDALRYGYGICDEVARGLAYAAVMFDVKRDILPNDEQAANFVVTNAMTLCPMQIEQLRNSAAGYTPGT